MMTQLQDLMLRMVQYHAVRKTALLTGDYLKAAPAEKEAIQAGIHIEKWLAQTCEYIKNRP